MNKMALKGKHIFKHQFFKQVMQPNHVSFKCYQLNTLEFFFNSIWEKQYIKQLSKLQSFLLYP
jgi:hypothetical protein